MWPGLVLLNLPSDLEMRLSWTGAGLRCTACPVLADALCAQICVIAVAGPVCGLPPPSFAAAIYGLAVYACTCCFHC